MYDTIKSLKVGSRVVVIIKGTEIGRGVVVKVVGDHDYLEVRFDGERGTGEWEGRYCWGE